MHFIKREDDISLHLFCFFWLLDKEGVDFKTHSSSKALLSEDTKRRPWERESLNIPSTFDNRI